MLSGVTIIDLSRLVPGPFCSMLLADLGARVIRVEPPATPEDVSGVVFPSLSRGKETVVLDLKQAAAREVFFRLVGRADAVLEGFRPGTVDRLGVGYEAVRSVNPGIVYVSISAYGQDSPMAARAGHDVNSLAAAGTLDLMVHEGAAPGVPAVQFADTAGSLVAAVALLAALHERDRTGAGRRLDISMTEAARCLAVTSADFHGMGWPSAAAASVVGGGMACYGTYRTRDGRLMAVGALEPHFFRRLCDAVGAPDLPALQFDRSRQAEVRSRLTALFLSRTAAEWESIFSHVDACVSPAVPFLDALGSEDGFASGALRSTTLPDGRGVTTVGMPVPWPGPRPGSGPVPRKGEHTDRVLAEFGYTADEIAALRSTGAVG